jgi:endo-1,4-beta-mannosidase
MESAPGKSSGSHGRHLRTPGRFATGVNYWASHAATAMWTDWREDVVDDDFKRLSEHGLTVARVFPLWSDFQPIHRLELGDGTLAEFRFGEAPLPDTPAGRAGVDERMLSRLVKLADLAQKHGIDLVVALVTGQMTYRLYMPPGLVGRSPIRDPLALNWQRRYVQALVGALKAHPAVVAWDFGNEVNCMGKADSTAEAWHWMASTVDAIRAIDATRPIISGMDAGDLVPPNGAATPNHPHSHWPAAAQAEHCEVLTTHHYVMWKKAGRDTCDSFKGVMLPSAEVRAAADVTGRSCFVEEIGLWRPLMASMGPLSAYINNVLWNLWASDGRGLLWWCAFDQDGMNMAPYDWEGPGPEHGLFSASGAPHPTAQVLARFRSFLDGLPFQSLPPLETEAICILGDRRQDATAVSASAFMLARQAGFNLKFQHSQQELEKAPLYLLPSVHGRAGLTSARWDALKDRVRAGATLFLSMDEPYLPHFEEVFGAQVVTRTADGKGRAYRLDAGSDVVELSFSPNWQYAMESTRATILGKTTEGNPVFFEREYGAGKVFLLAFPLERLMMDVQASFQSPATRDAWKIYQHIAKGITAGKAFSPVSPLVTLTEHVVDGAARIGVLVNNSPEAFSGIVPVNGAWKMTGCHAPSATARVAMGGIQVTLPGNEGIVLIMER